MTFILGISAFYHDSAASLLKDGKIIAAAQEERSQLRVARGHVQEVASGPHGHALRDCAVAHQDDARDGEG